MSHTEEVDLLSIDDPVSALEFLGHTASYFHALCFTKYTAPTKPQPHSEHLAIEYRLQLYLASNIVMDALKNQIVINETFENLLAQAKNPQHRVDPEFPPKEDGVSQLVSGPAHVCDRNGRLLFLHLPRVLTAVQLDIVEEACRDLVNAPHSKMEVKTDGSWRSQAKYFKDTSTSEFTPGVLSLSPCWFMQNHPPPKHKPMVSASIRRRDGKDGGIPFVRAMREAFSLIGAVLYVLNPSQYEQGVETWQKLAATNCEGSAPKCAELMAGVLRIWASPFTVTQVISNRETPFHFDTLGNPNWYDCLLTVGRYGGGRLELKRVGRHFRYERGTMAFILSQVLEHGVAEVDGERICLASFMRPEVLKYILEWRAHASRPETVHSIEERLGVPEAERRGI
ncbi:hypothetical protein CC1G_13531 [Coprinopsis cinerea okayama7|uniref:2OGFeDO JBP1/TET oxygenase domain-containing protein n=1 Tax=Coprinopsis cinerea (strain Okayama-7 / 130 / ATCC MYA-4618 / FGSC 9003) TaxID=240176 RepID=A8NZ90_COPC7|nr:hypothetical protein CC1G_13531 [Coprinopsis cinerea okayama7\|eukprot:XP_001837632.2 hypothetical protein CC1G_13531 [Coprinopsis cinerea okayama7\